ncbi:MAG: class I SAM-dependent methyltransferase [Planctomycetota bacterium]|nr:class I SAM-dependent methyltransferase [Planctomycetota bacterium]
MGKRDRVSEKADGVTPLEAANLNGSRKTAFVSSLFDRVAPRYDRMNDIISLGATTRWRVKALRLLKIPRDARLLDVGTGCGIAAGLSCREATGRKLHRH